jgi:predicted aldo/keto reductase-like oxidoreductase
MNHENQIIENIKTCEHALPGSITLIERGVIGEVAEYYKRLINVRCNGCAYCMPCPYGVNIPRCFSLYNQYFTTDRKLKTRALYGLDLRGASLCKNCGECIKICPQHIAIPVELKKVSKHIGGLPTKIPLLCIKLMRSLRN